MEAEREHTLATLVMFKKFNPPVFDGEKVEPWMVESWIDSMETLFEDIYTLEKDKVLLATHCLEKAAKVYEKKKLQDKFWKLRQGDRSVREYEREFSHIIDCVPDVVRDDKDRADWFLRGLRPKIYEAVQILKLRTFAEVLDRALWAEHGSAYARGERESMEKERDKGKKRTASATGIGRVLRGLIDVQAGSQRTGGLPNVSSAAVIIDHRLVRSVRGDVLNAVKLDTLFGSARVGHRLPRRLP
uniref:Retrotransposon gag domain-containing protein n=1 Tax=Ananas comosus var. bracteatus TaxID=296719 RepID=A0A6V7P505_ANACO|nr:unnamed protein product [Ananas comosus var. bracteatus]